MPKQIKAPRGSRLVNTCPIYYGWIILAVGAIGIILTSPGQTYAVSVFIDHFITDLGTSRSLVSTLYMAGTLTASLAMPWVGRQLDRRGSRLMVVVVSLLLGFTCIYMSFVRGAIMLGIGFLALRLLGQGSLSMVSKNAINQWWVRRRGMVMGIAGMSWAFLGSAGFPNLINALIPRFGWRTTYTLLGLVLLLVMFPLGLIFMRDRPEDYGLMPDGFLSDASEDEPHQEPIEDNWTLSEALRTPTFWLVAAGLASMSMLGTGLTFHIFSIFRDCGLSSTVTAAVFVPIAVTSAVVQLAGGILIDRLPIRVMLAVSLLLQTVILMSITALRSVQMAMGLGLVMGTRQGLQLIVSSIVWAKYFGRLHLGSIMGVTATLMVGSSALGPLPFGIARDVLGNYTAVLWGFATLPFLLAIANLLFAKTPRRS